MGEVFDVTTITNFTKLVSFIMGGDLSVFINQGQELLNIVAWNHGLSDIRFLNESLWTCSPMVGTFSFISGFIKTSDPVGYLQAADSQGIYDLQNFVKSAIVENGYMKMILAQIYNVFS